MKLRLIVPFLLALALAPLAAAQSLADLLPAETMLALGASGLDDHRDLLDDFIQEFEQRGVGDALTQVFSDVDDDVEEMDAEIPAELEGFGPLDLIGQEAWIALSASQFNPIPVVTLLARMSPEATMAFADLIADAAGQEGVQQLSEGGIDFWVMPLDEPDSPVQAVAYAQADGVTMLASNPDVLRGVLRRLTGSGEPAFTTSDAYASTLGQLGDGQLYGFLDLGAVADVVAPFSQGMGFGPQVQRLQRALATYGSSAGVMRIVPDGLESASITVPDPAGGDVGLFNLLTAEGTYDAATLQYVPTTALGVTTGYADLTGWWNYLNDLVGNLPELGIQSLDQALIDFLGLDLRATFFDWTGTQAGTITTGVAAMAEPGMAPSNFLGEQVYVIETTSDEAARAGLQTLFTTLASTVSAFADPAGGAGGANVGQQTIAGVPVDTYTIMEGLQFATAVTGGYALIATSLDAMEDALSAAAANDGLAPVFAGLLATVPSDATSLTLSDSRATLEATALQFASMMQLGAGFGGASNLDFDAVSQASETVEGYLLFVASRLGGSVTWSQVVDQTIRGSGRTAISW